MSDRDRRVAASRHLVDRAEQAKRGGQIKDYIVVACADDPELVDHVTLIPPDPPMPEGFELVVYKRGGVAAHPDAAPMIFTAGQWRDLGDEILALDGSELSQAERDQYADEKRRLLGD